MMVHDPDIAELRHMIEEAQRIVVFTGAGISTESGIPDFRSPTGIWKTMPLIHFSEFLASKEMRRESWRRRFGTDQTMRLAEPNRGHRAISTLVRRGKVSSVITQNIDGLHQRAGLAGDQVLELHGTMYSVVCTSCGARTAMSDALVRVRAGEADPPCADCGGILKSATVMFGQSLDTDVLSRAAAAAQAADLFLAIGSTLTVEPAASLCAVAVRAGAQLVIVNRDPTPYDEIATGIIREPISAAVPTIVDLLIARQA
jgi:NAD-dependent deacetylase